MKHEKCLREFGMFDLEKMIKIFKEELFVSLVI